MSKDQINKNLDSDHDGLSDAAEINFYKTNPYQADTDGDGVDDGTEISLGRNPRGFGLWQDLFIPNSRNNFKPRVLHPKRIFFYSLSAITIKALVVIMVLSFPIQAWLTPDLLAQQSQRIVDVTNNLRATLDINPLNNNPILQQAALAKTEDMLVNQYFAHVSPEKRGLKYWLSKFSYDYQVAGENLALGFVDPDEVVRAWQASPTHYSNLIDPDFKEIGVAMVSGNYQGYDTTLVAQFFGTKPTTLTETTTTAELVVISPDQALTEVSNNNTQVLADKELPKPIVVSEPKIPVRTAVKMSNPTLVSPANHSSTKDELVHLVISAPQAKQLAIWSGETLLKTINVNNNQAETDLSINNGENQVFFEAIDGDNRAYSAVYTLILDQEAPAIDQDRTEISATKPIGQDSIILKVDAYLSEDTASAKVQLANYEISLSPDSYNPGHWSGHLLVNDDGKNLFNPLLMASLTAEDQLGNVASSDISWGTIPPVTTGVIKQYLFLRDNNSVHLAPIFDISSIYYKVILVLAVISLLLNIFIEIKKQHPKTIASTMGFIALLVFLILF